METTERVTVTLSRPAALALVHWLTVVPENLIPVTHPGERQALADLLTALEMQGPTWIGEDELRTALATLLESSGDWVHDGPVYTAAK